MARNPSELKVGKSPARTTRQKRRTSDRPAAPAIIDEAKSIVAVEEVIYNDTVQLPICSSEDSLGVATALAGKQVEGVQVARSFMNETFGGGSLEHVPGFDSTPALTMHLAQPGAVHWPQFSRQGSVQTAETVWVPESVIGSDTRRPVPNAASLPWRCIALLQIFYTSGQTGRGTGWFIGPRTLVTAAHCVHHEEGRDARRIIVTPGYERGAAPYGQFEVSGSLWNPAWRGSYDPVLDFALIFLNTDPGVGFFGYAAVSDANLQRVIVNLAGYPKDRPATQWYDAGRLSGAEKHFIYHQIDTEEGQSGAPVFWTDRVQRIGLGIHTYGTSAGRPSNRARRITPELFTFFQQNTR
ncbi:MAG TPA: trypsin-like peptidase domain-containing protein [Pedomonas sp.]|uniref:trypsin-like serine peptidase n=1 Tax=Pedomonas sp. TaxID=2976421 RepID=UPI002F3F537B